MTRVLTLLECGGIQEYVFGSGRLSEAVGASYLVSRAVSSTTIEDAARRAGATAKILYAGGGNAAVLFDDLKAAQRTCWAWSLDLHRRAPGLRVHAAHSEAPDGGLGEALGDAHRRLAATKLAGEPGRELGRLPFTEGCYETGLPAADLVSDAPGSAPGQATPRANRRPVSRVSISRRDAATTAATQFETELGERGLLTSAKGTAYRLTLQLDQLGQTEGEDHLAVVHVDGNGIGRRLVEVAGRGGTDEDVCDRLKRFADDLETASRDALHATIRALVKFLDDHTSLDPAKDGRGPLLPLRPILSGGDDVTFICEGRVGLWLAEVFLREFGKHELRDDRKGGPLSACAGVAIAGTHFPIARSYGLASELCRSAKRRGRAKGGGSWVDFHIALGGATGGIAQLRAEQYEIAREQVTYQLLWRPWRVLPDEAHDRWAWTAFRSAAKALSSGEWSAVRSKRRALRDALEGGPEQTAVALRRAPAVPAFPGIVWNEDADGWYGSQTPLYDVLEALDFTLGITD